MAARESAPVPDESNGVAYNLTIDSAPDSIDVDIVTVPAIGAHALRTWNSPNGESWLTTDLRVRIPSARILCYGHSRVGKIDRDLRRLSLNLLTLLVRERSGAPGCPLVFICHSTGGLVVREALSIARNLARVGESPQVEILKNCVGIAFFSTPHQGSVVLSDPLLSRRVKERLGTDAELPSALQNYLNPTNTEFAAQIQTFSQIAREMKIWTFIEGRQTNLSAASRASANPTSVYVVSNRSAYLDFAQEVSTQLDCDHIHICKFGSNPQDSAALEKFTTELGDLVQQFRRGYDTGPATLSDILRVEIHQFYVPQPSLKQALRSYLNHSKQARNSTGPVRRPVRKLKIFSTSTSIDEFVEHGPSRCLQTAVSVDTVSPLPAYDTRKANFSRPTRSLSRRPSSHEQSSPDLARGNSFLRRTSDAQSPTAASSSSSATVIPLGSSQSNLLHGIAHSPWSKIATPILDSQSFSAPKNAFLKPHRQKIRWIHVPNLQIDMVPQILLATASENPSSVSSYKPLIKPHLWSERKNKARHDAHHARYMIPTCKMLYPEIWADRLYESGVLSNAEWNLFSGNSHSAQLALFSSYLHWDTYKSLQKREKVIKDYSNSNDTHNLSQMRLERNASTELQVIWHYRSNLDLLYCRRTLDQYGLPHLGDLSVRNDDQMIYKASLGPNAKVLMVDQLLLWVLDEKTVVTFFAPKAEERPTLNSTPSQLGDLKESILRDVGDDKSTPLESSLDLAALILDHSVTVFLSRITKQAYHNHKDLDVFRVFEERISYLTEKQTESFRRFRDDGNTLDEDVHREDLHILLELEDVEDELKIIQKLLTEQSDRIQEMKRFYAGVPRDLSGDMPCHLGLKILTKLIEKVETYHRQLRALLQSARASQKAMRNVLNLKQNWANLIEAQAAAKAATKATAQGRVVLVFTVFTVIFLPLSFFTGLFGINVREFVGDTQSRISIKTFAIFTGSISAFVIILAFVFAFSNLPHWATRYLSKGDSSNKRGKKGRRRAGGSGVELGALLEDEEWNGLEMLDFQRRETRLRGGDVEI